MQESTADSTKWEIEAGRTVEKVSSPSPDITQSTLYAHYIAVRYKTIKEHTYLKNGATTARSPVHIAINRNRCFSFSLASFLAQARIEIVNNIKCISPAICWAVVLLPSFFTWRTGFAECFIRRKSSEPNEKNKNLSRDIILYSASSLSHWIFYWIPNSGICLCFFSAVKKNSHQKNLLWHCEGEQSKNWTDTHKKD